MGFGLRRKMDSTEHTTVSILLTLLATAILTLAVGSAHALALEEADEEPGTEVAQATPTRELPPVSAEQDAVDEAEPVAEATGQKKDEFGGIENIVISARKKKEALQTVPIAVTALNANDLAAQNVDDTLDIQFKVPNLLFSKGNFTGANLQIRGIGVAAVAFSADGGVGVNVNQIPLPNSRLFEQEFFDVERVEVLRGPQGTLFGRNSTGGSFNITTQRPTDEWSSEAEATFGNFDAIKLKGAVNMPVHERFRMRFAGMFLKRDGFIENLATNNDIDDRELYGIRGSFQADVTEHTQVNLMISWFEEDDQRSRIGKQLCKPDNGANPSFTGPPFALGCGPGKQGFGSYPSYSTLGGLFEDFVVPGATSGDPGGPVVLNPVAAPPAPNPADLRVHNARFDPQYKTDELFINLEISHDWNEYTFTALAAYVDTSVDSRQDYTMGRPGLPYDPTAVGTLLGGNIPGMTDLIDASAGQPAGTICFPGLGCYDSSFALDRSNVDSQQFSLEGRVSSSYDGPLNFTSGVSYTHASAEGNYFVWFSGAEIYGRRIGANFGGLRSQGGLYDDDLLPFNNDTNPYILNSLGVFGEGYWDAMDDVRVTLGLRYTHDDKLARGRSTLLTPVLTIPGLGGLKGYDRQTNTWDEVTGKLTADWQPDLEFTDDTLLFASVARGYKGGGFNPPVSAVSVEDTFKPEFIWAYEIGTKNTLLDRRLQANVTGFFYDYRDYQVSQIVQRTAVNDNVDAFVWGLEMEFLAAPLDDFLINFSVSYLGSEIQSGTSIDPLDPTAGDTSYVALKNVNPDPADPGRYTGSNVIVPIGDITGNPFTTASVFANQLDGLPKDLDGRELPSTPEIQIQLGAQYTQDAPWGGVLIPRLDFYWQADMFARYFNETRDVIDEWSQLDMSLTYIDESEHMSVEIWVKNVADEDDITGMYLTDASSGLFTNAFVLDPRTFGVTVGVKF